MKILYFCHEFPVLSETFMIYEIYDLIQQGVDVRVYTLTNPKPEQRSNLPSELGFENRIYTRPPLKTSSLSRGLQKYKLMAKLGMQGKLEALKKLFSDGSSAQEYSRYMLLETAAGMQMEDGWTPDIIHCHFGTVGRLVSILKHYGLIDTKITTIFHGYDISRYPLQKGKHCYDTLFAQGDLFLTVNSPYLEKIKELGARPEKSRIFHMGVDMNAFTYHPRNITAGQKIDFISIGRMTEKKGHEFTIRAFAELKKRNPAIDVHLHMIGDGPLKKSLELLVSELKMDTYITLHGVLQHKDVKRHLAEAHIFVLPSVTASDGDMEGIPVVLMEAMAQGLPVISSVHSGIPDLIVNGQSGYLATERNVPELADVMEKLVTNPQEWKTITDTARATVEDEFNRIKQSKALYQHFTSLLSS